MFLQKFFLQKVYDELDEFCNEATPTIIAVSGGVDSMALAYVMFGYWKNKFNDTSLLNCVIVDHKLREESSHEALITKRNLKNIGFQNITIKTWNHNIIVSNVEENARNARYTLLKNVANEISSNKIFLGHHLNDQIETFFLNSLRGSGVLGLACMKNITKLNENISIYRPFLKISKEEIIEFCTENNIPWIEDKSNYDTRFRRNKYRDIMQKMVISQEDYQKISTTINAMQDAYDVIEEIVENFIKKAEICDNYIKIPLDIFVKQKKAVKLYIIYKIFDILKTQPPRASQILDFLQIFTLNTSFEAKKIYLSDITAKFSSDSIIFLK